VLPPRNMRVYLHTFILTATFSVELHTKKPRLRNSSHTFPKQLPILPNWRETILFRAMLASIWPRLRTDICTA